MKVKVHGSKGPYSSSDGYKGPGYNTMRILTNRYRDCELLNLGSNKNGRGPYVLRQDGVPPDSLHGREDRFLLRKDGTWVLNITEFTLPDQDAEMYSTVEKLFGKPVLEDALPPGKSRAELLTAIETTISKVWSRMREARATRLTKPGI